MLWGNAYRSEAFIGGIRGQTLAGHAVMSKKLKTQRAWKTIQNTTTRDYEQTRIIHRGAVKNRTNYMCRYVHSRHTLSTAVVQIPQYKSHDTRVHTTGSHNSDGDEELGAKDGQRRGRAGGAGQRRWPLALASWGVVLRLRARILAFCFSIHVPGSGIAPL